MISTFPEFLCHTLHIATIFSPCCNHAALDHGNHQKPISRLGQRGFSDLQDQLCLFGRPKLGYTNQSKSSISAPKCWDISHLQSPALVFFDPGKSTIWKLPFLEYHQDDVQNSNYTKSRVFPTRNYQRLYHGLGTERHGFFYPFLLKIHTIIQHFPLQGSTSRGFSKFLRVNSETPSHAFPEVSRRFLHLGRDSITRKQWCLDSMKRWIWLPGRCLVDYWNTCMIF